MGFRVFVCVCVCVRERERENHGNVITGDRQKKGVGEQEGRKNAPDKRNQEKSVKMNETENRN